MNVNITQNYTTVVDTNIGKVHCVESPEGFIPHRTDGPAVSSGNNHFFWLSGFEYEFDVWSEILELSKEDKLIMTIRYGL